jgi:hypothetical protein
MILREDYARLNASFTRKLYFHLGVNAGFFSEFNYLLLAMLSCLENHIQFVLYSADANFKVDKGWDDFFRKRQFLPPSADSPATPDLTPVSYSVIATEARDRRATV